jgi:hypothetical protein
MANPPPAPVRGDLSALGFGLLRDLASGEGAAAALDGLSRRLGLLRDGAAAQGQWRRARAALLEATAGGCSRPPDHRSPQQQQQQLLLLLPPARLLQELAHDRLHTGHWSAVPETWRDAHAAATLCGVGARLSASPPAPGAAPSAAAAPLQPAALSRFLGGPAAPPRDVLRAALRALDVAIILGCPGSSWLRAALDRAADRVDVALAALEEEEEEGQEDAASKGGGGSRPVPKRRRLFSSASTKKQQQPEQQQPPPPPPPPTRRSLRPPTLPPRSLTPHSTARLPSSDAPPPLDLFLSRHLLPCSPLLIRSGTMTAWPALERWRDPEYLLRVAGRRTVPVEVGAHFLDPALASPLVPFGAFLRGLLLDEEEEEERTEEDPNLDTHPPPTTEERSGGVGAIAATAAASCSAPPRRAYLAQHPLLDQLPRLRRDVMVPDYCALCGGGGAVAVHAWLGGPGAVTPLHHDGARHNLLCVVVGRKYVRLYPPGEETERALRPLPPPNTNASGLVPCDLLLSSGEGEEEGAAAAAAAALAALDGAAMADVMLGPGQALYIPPGWWHYVSSWAEDEEEQEGRPKPTRAPSEEEEEEHEGKGHEEARREAAAAAPRLSPPPPPPYCFAVSFWWS